MSTIGIVKEAIASFQQAGLGKQEIPFAHEQCPSVFGIPQLQAHPTWDLPSLQSSLDQHHEAITKEFLSLQASPIAVSETIRSNVEAGQWRTFFLVEEGDWNAVNVALCPRTVAVLQSLSPALCRSR